MNRNRSIILISLILVAALAVLGFLILRQDKENLPPAAQTETESQFAGKPLPQDKETLKNQLVGHLGSGGTITETSDFNIHYFAPDIFQVEIKTTDVADAREEAITWFKSKGFNEEDICKLPVTFYLNAEVVGKLEGSGVIFNALPEFCR